MRNSLLYLVLIAIALSTQTIAQEAKLAGFGPPAEGTSLPGFGSLAEPLPTLVQEDRAYSAMQFEQYDLDKDGAIDRDETRKTPYKGVEGRWFSFDADRDNQLSRTELANFYARTRIDKTRKLQRAARAKRKAAGIEISSADLANSKNQFAQLDRNRDRKLDKREVAAGWGNQTGQIFADHDLNASGYLTSKELAGQWAVVRTNQEKQQRAMQVQLTHLHFGSYGSGLRVVQPQTLAGPSQVLIGRYDTNRNGILERSEWRQIEGRFDGADGDRNGSLTQQELNAWLARARSRPAARVASGASWFSARDANRDGQVSMSEYASQWTTTLARKFARLDHNGDGMISAEESRSSPVRSGRVREFASDRSAVIEAGVGTRLSIQVDEAFEIADVNIRLSISHLVPQQLDAFVVSPSGKRVELFKGADKPWKGGNFDATLFDHEATSSIAKAAPPFQGAHMPEGKPGLASIYGEPSQGVWRLFVRADRGDRPGLLHGWSLELVPKSAE